MKYLKTYEKLLHTVKYSNIDKLVCKIKRKFEYRLEKEFSKYLTPTTIESINNRKSRNEKAFLLEPDYGVKFSIDFETYPYRKVANISIIYIQNDRWRRGTYTQYSDNSVISIEDFVSKYVDDLKIKYKRREERKLKNDIKKYNL